LALRYRSDCPEAHNTLANALLAQNKLEDAVKHLHEALRLSPAFPEAHTNLAHALLRQGKVEQAVIHCRHALHYRPDFPPAYANLAMAFELQDNLNEAIKHYGQALTLNPYYAEAHCGLGALLRRLGKLDEALAHCQKALALQPRLAVAHHDMGLALAACGKLEEAKEHFRLALELNPHYATLWGLSSQHLSELGMHDAPRAIPASEVSTESYAEIDGYFEFAAVYDLAVKECPRGVFIEVGAFLGRSTAYLASKIRNLPVKLYVVDTWRGSGGADRQGDEQYTPMLVMNNGDLFDTFLDNMERCGVVQTLIPLRLRSVQAAKLFGDESIEFCYLDAAHDYDSVKADLTAWFPKVKGGGIIAGDDYCVRWPGVVRAVNEFFADASKITTIATSWVFRKP
jgi:tetratricopeptide (TPR) repeat protein